jgi:hypothetical protein
MALPSDLLIFRPFSVKNPCTKSSFGSGNRAERRRAGQYTVWNFQTFFPMT